MVRRPGGGKSGPSPGHTLARPLLSPGRRKGTRVGRLDAAERRAILGPFRRIEARRHLQDLLADLGRERDRFLALEGKLEPLTRRPFLLAYGALDNGFATGVFERWQTLFPQHRVAVHPRAGHFLAEDDPAFFALALTRWFERDVR